MDRQAQRRAYLESIQDPLEKRSAMQAKPVGLDQLYNQLSGAFPNSNMAKQFGLYFNPGIDVQRLPGNYNASGWVSHRDPNTMWIGRDELNTTTPAHESAHIQQLSRPRQDYNKHDDMMGLRVKLMMQQRKHPYKIPSNSGGNWQEAMATLQELEGELPSGQTFDQHPALQNLFSDREKEMAHKLMFYNQNKVMPGPEQQIRQPPWLDRMRRRIRNFTAY